MAKDILERNEAQIKKLNECKEQNSETIDELKKQIEAKDKESNEHTKKIQQLQNDNKKLKDEELPNSKTSGKQEENKAILEKIKSKFIDLKDVMTIEDALKKLTEAIKNYKDKEISNILEENILLQKYPSVTRTNFNNYIKSKDLTCIPKMEVVSHSLLTSLVENGFGIGLLTKEFISNKLNNTLFEIKTNIEIPTRLLVYATKSNSVPSFATIKFIELLKKDLTN